MSARNIVSMSSKDNEFKDNEGRILTRMAERPTFILKTREGESRAVSPSQRNGNKKENDVPMIAANKTSDPRTAITIYQEMTCSVKFMDENLQLCEAPLEYLYDQQDFLVVGCLGTQGVGKSTIMSLLTSDYCSRPDIFPVQDITHYESGANCTGGVDFFVTKNRVIYLDTQPILSGSVIDYSSVFDQKKLPTDFTNTDINLELQSLQFAAFLFSVCHVIIFVQDWFVDPNLIRFLQTAEMLKPSSTTSMDQDYVEYYPHILFLHNKAELQDMVPSNIEKMKDFYNKVLSNSRLQTNSGLGMDENSNESGLNLFVVPFITSDVEEATIRHNEKELIEKLRRKIHGVSRNAMTPSVLTERNWYHYVSKVMEAIKKSHLSSEYGRLMP